jgi:hypothetical protein
MLMGRRLRLMGEVWWGRSCRVVCMADAALYISGIYREKVFKSDIVSLGVWVEYHNWILAVKETAIKNPKSCEGARTP